MNSFRILSEIPIWIKWMSISLFLCILWLWIWDTYFSIYIEEIVQFSLWISLFWALYSLVKLVTVIPIWMLNDKWKTEGLLILGKVSWMVSWLFYFLAWIYHSWIYLFIWTVFSWIAWSIIYPSYWSLYKKWGDKKNHWMIFWLYYQSINFAYCAWAFICAIAIIYLKIPYIFLFMVFFILLSLLWDKRIKEIALSKDKLKELSKARKWLIPLMIKNTFSIKPWKEIVFMLKSYQWSMYSALWAQSLISLMEYVGFLFIPIIAIDNNLNLSQVAIITAIMWLPSIFNAFAWSLWDKYNKKLLIWIFLLIWGILYVVLWYCTTFWWIMITTFFVSSIITFIFPLVSALISDGVKSKEEGTIAWVKEFIWTSWEIFGSLWFWVLISSIWLEMTFIIFGCMLIMLALYIICKKSYQAVKERS